MIPLVSPPRRKALRVLAAALALASAGVQAQEFPSKSVRIVVPFPAGGPSDVLGRLLAEKLTAKWGKSVYVDNKPGALTALGATEVKRAAPDGHTLLIGIDATYSINPHVFAKLPYDPLKDFAHISLVVTQSTVLLANKTTSIDSVPALIAYAKANPGKVNYAAATTSLQLAGAMFDEMANVQMTMIPYKGNSDALNGMLAGDVQVSFDGIAATIPYINNGTFRALATTGLARSQSLPTVPTLHELGLKNFEIRIWNGLSAPAGTPRPVIDKIQRDVAEVVNEPAVKDKLLSLGMEVVASTPEEFVQTIQRDSVKYAPLVKKLGLRIE